MLAINTPQAEMDSLFERLFAVEEALPASSRPREATPRLDFEPEDTEILDKCRSDKNGAKFTRLFNDGDWDSGDYPSPSEARFGLIGHLSYYIGRNPDRIDRLFRDSRLMTSKWDEPRGNTTFGFYEIGRLLAKKTDNDFYDWGRDAQKEAQKGKPVLDVGQPFDVQLDDMHAAILAGNVPEPQTFTNGAGLAVMDFSDKPIIRQVTVPMLRESVARRMQVVREKQTKKGPEDEATDPPINLLRTYLESPLLRDFPKLKRISAVPLVTSDGVLSAKYGFNEENGIFVAERGLEALMPAKPGKADVRAAIAFYNDWFFHDFPFADDASRTHAFCAVLQHYVRDLIYGYTPMYLFKAPKPGTGKSILAAGLSEINAPGVAGMPMPPSAEEFDKRIFGKLSAGATHIFFDNVRGKVDMGALDMVLTAEVYEGRLLGTNAMRTLDNRATYLMTGNNPDLGPDLPSRCVLIHMDAGMDQPQTRTKFKIKETYGWSFSRWVRESRLECVKHALVLVQYWLQEGMPRYSGKNSHRAEDWVSVMGGLCECVGLPGFLDNTKALEKADPELAVTRRFVEMWYEGYGTRRVGTSALAGIAYGDVPSYANERDDEDRIGPLWTETIHGKPLQARAAILGKWMTHHENGTYNGLSIKISEGKGKHSCTYQLIVTPGRVKYEEEQRQQADQED